MFNFISTIVIMNGILTQMQATRVFTAGPSYTNDLSIITPQYQPLHVSNQFFCPPEDDDRKLLNKCLANDKNTLLTLIPKIPDPNKETLCKYEVQPIFDYRSEYENRKIEPWDVDNNYGKYFFFFQVWFCFLSPSEYCEIMTDNSSKSCQDIIISPIYDIVHDFFMKRVMLTRHKITSLENISDYQALQDQLFNSVNDSSTKSYLFDEGYFIKILNAFQLYNSNAKNPKMIKQKLVPEQNLAPLRNKATKHIINVAPLWDELALLMAVINNAIQRVNNQIKRIFSRINNHLRNTNPAGIHELIIYTGLFYPKKTIQETFINKLEIPDIWCKFVHYRAKKSGILIYIHNTPYEPPQEADKHCKIQDRVDCNFDNWIENNYQGIGNVQYAYCCTPSASILEEQFWIKDEIKSVLNIEEIITKSTRNTEISDKSTSKRISDDSSMENEESRKQQKIIILDY